MEHPKEHNRLTYFSRKLIEVASLRGNERLSLLLRLALMVFLRFALSNCFSKDNTKSNGGCKFSSNLYHSLLLNHFSPACKRCLTWEREQLTACLPHSLKFILHPKEIRLKVCTINFIRLESVPGVVCFYLFQLYLQFLCSLMMVARDTEIT